MELRGVHAMRNNTSINPAERYVRALIREKYIVSEVLEARTSSQARETAKKGL
jgi:hypothetical protein